jgi:hypothetical protein
MRLLVDLLGKVEIALRLPGSVVPIALAWVSARMSSGMRGPISLAAGRKPSSAKATCCSGSSRKFMNSRPALACGASFSSDDPNGTYGTPSCGTITLIGRPFSDWYSETLNGR